MDRFEAASIAASASASLPDESEEPPGKPRRLPKWRDVPDQQWDDWRWQSQNAIRTTAQLAEFFAFSPQELSALEVPPAQVGDQGRIQQGDDPLSLDDESLDPGPLQSSQEVSASFG